MENYFLFIYSKRLPFPWKKFLIKLCLIIQNKSFVQNLVFAFVMEAKSDSCFW